jgi:NitT/TauT family transport system ATP-binding protein
MSLSNLQAPSAFHLPGGIQMRQVAVSFGRGPIATEAVRNVTLDIAPGEFVSVLGPSGCGKSTLIGAISGFTPITAGELLVDGQPVRRPGPDRGVVFQHHALFPWKTVLGNVEFGLKMNGVARAERRRQAGELLDEVGLGSFLHHYPSQLSGGMQQRVSLARSLVNRPRVLLMDEPFSALDAQTRLQMQRMLLDLWAAHRLTVFFVTHDIDEALFLSDRVLVVSHRPGRIKAELPVTLARPRTAESFLTPEFMALKRNCMSLMQSRPTAPLPLSSRECEAETVAVGAPEFEPSPLLASR